ncbi:U1 small nuclear ribonucleoprotein C-like [Cynara cardunculus var. scolymus]|uniref:U1 small nuclear ribonucleoprotein C-like n=1 Tax=Cynara cardunculus var. scolymus TaxID=59895 RepID=UPI000D62BBA0|nr:U1 small nuclear ribonucleoprotein C-like [Cynara cardunculus var. scolymus]XP_024981486.1 U1 small nuclear ribonucleoprotein C-like [Cynara cardunculus var. scolymus]
MPRYYCDYCDTYLTHDSPSVRKQHNAGYKHKANVRIYYQQYEAQQNQYLIDQKVKEHLGQAAAYQQVGAAYNQLRPRLPVLPTPMMPMPGNPQMAMNPSLMPGMRPPISLPRPMPGYPGMPQMVTPPGATSMPGQINPSMPGQVNNGVPRPMTMSAPMMVPGSSGTPTSGAPPMFAPSMYQASPTPPPPPAVSGGFETTNANAQSQDADH